jgi:thiosulfate/3-mercaptopyruvate sulfurtransferase
MTMQRRFIIAFLLATCSIAAVLAADNQQVTKPGDLISPSQLNTQLPAVKSGKIVLIYVGFRTMYEMAHIPDSKYPGSGSREEGLAGLKKLVANLPRNKSIVIYCGCCPWNHCPNIQPAFHVLKQMGFSNVKALDIPERLGDDWTAKGYPTVSGE